MGGADLEVRVIHLVVLHRLFEGDTIKGQVCLGKKCTQDKARYLVVTFTVYPT